MHLRQRKKSIFGENLLDGAGLHMSVVNLAFSACALRATTKKRSSTF